ncbi:hypothetical protein FOZ62_010836, partial [Perkinsus olseni]
ANVTLVVCSVYVFGFSSLRRHNVVLSAAPKSLNTDARANRKALGNFYAADPSDRVHSFAIHDNNTIVMDQASQFVVFHIASPCCEYYPGPIDGRGPEGVEVE